MSTDLLYPCFVWDSQLVCKFSCKKQTFLKQFLGMIDASMFPQMGYIVDVRHVGVYGSIYAIADAAFCFAFALGPFFSGPFVRTLGFPT